MKCYVCVHIYFNKKFVRRILQLGLGGKKYDLVANKKEVIPGGKRENKSRKKLLSRRLL